jgi:hypothetical protein
MDSTLGKPGWLPISMEIRAAGLSQNRNRANPAWHRQTDIQSSMQMKKNMELMPC